MCISLLYSQYIKFVFLSSSHRLEYFKDFRLQSIMGEGWVQPPSDLWLGKP